jgi:hypothetical protein
VLGTGCGLAAGALAGAAPTGAAEPSTRAAAGAGEAPADWSWFVELPFAEVAPTEITFVCETTSSPGLLIRMITTTFDWSGSATVAVADDV